MNNLTLRTITGIAFVLVIVASLMLKPLLFGAVFLTVMLFSLDEFYNISMGDEYPAQRRLALLTSTVFFITVYSHVRYGISISWLCLSFLLLLTIGISFIFLTREERVNLEKLPLVYTGLAYIALPIGLSPFLVYRCGYFDGKLLLAFFVLIWISDIGAYCLGSIFGQKENSRKLAPSISPKKSWVGFWSGILFSIIASVVLYYTGLLPFKLVQCVSLAIIISVSGVCGDLFESVWKRHYGVKDSGNCIPGHGGMLDRFDSSFFAVPIACIYLTLTGQF